MDSSSSGKRRGVAQQVTQQPFGPSETRCQLRESTAAGNMLLDVCSMRVRQPPASGRELSCLTTAQLLSPGEAGFESDSLHLNSSQFADV